MAKAHPQQAETLSDAALVARLYELACELANGGNCNSDEFARIDALVYGRLSEAYGEDTLDRDGRSPANRSDS